MNGLLCPKCKSSAIVSNGSVPRKGGKVHTSRCNDCGHICTDDKLVKTVPGQALIREPPVVISFTGLSQDKEPPKPKKPIAETPKSRKLIDKGHELYKREVGIKS